jgi:hypothetical protein
MRSHTFFCTFREQVYTNIRVLRRLKKRPASSHSSVNARRHRTNQLIAVITLVFLLSYAPITGFRLVGELGVLSPSFVHSRCATLVYAILMLLCSSNAILNPILYDYVSLS